MGHVPSQPGVVPATDAEQPCQYLPSAIDIAVPQPSWVNVEKANVACDHVAGAVKFNLYSSEPVRDDGVVVTVPSQFPLVEVTKGNETVQPPTTASPFTQNFTP
jgi:hypothetical protein